MNAGRAVIGAMLAGALTLGTAALSRVPVTFAGDDEAALRLAWLLQGVAAEACRRPTPEELAKLPVHMRNPDACIGHIAPYLLTVRVDDEVLAHDTIHASGAREDRPLSVLRDVPLSVGSHRLEVEMRALLPPGPPTSEDAVAELRWAGVVTLGPREVALVTLDASGKTLELRTR